MASYLVDRNMPGVNTQEYMGKEYEVEYEGHKYKLKPLKVWVLQPRGGRKGIVIGLFQLPNGKKIRKAIGKIE